MYDLVTLGEILIDFSPDGFDKRGYPKYIQNPGGAVANVAAVFGKYGAKCALIGDVGTDLFGNFLIGFFDSIGVDTSGIVKDNEYNTTLAFVSLDKNGERDFAFYRRHEADLHISADDISEKMITDTKIFHFGSLSLCAEPARSATYYALNRAKASGALISYDPNYRESLWKDEPEHIEYMKSVLSKVDLIKVSEEEGEMLTGEKEPEKIADALFEYGIKLVAVTMGERGSYVSTAIPAWGEYIAPYKPEKTVDTTGAGDVYWGTMLYEFINKGWDTPDKILAAANRASKAAGMCTAVKGGASSIPSYAETER